MNKFFKTLQKYLLEYLPKQKCCSHNTIRSYKQALHLFVTYLTTAKQMKIKQIDFEMITREVVLDFLVWLEESRNCSASSRNQRLMVLRSFFHYSGVLDETLIALSFSINDIPLKKEQGKVVGFLTETALEALLAQPNTCSQKELRNQFFMILMYDTAGRCGEILGLKVRDLYLNTQYPIAYLHGKGNKTRSVPLLNKTVEHCKQYLKLFHKDEDFESEEYLFYTITHGV